VARAPGQALSDFNIFRLVAQYWGCGETFGRWSSPEAVFQILKDLSRGQPCDISGIRDYRMIDDCGGIQWPFPEGIKSQISNFETATGHSNSKTSRPIPPTERRLFEDGQFYHPDGKAKFLFDEPRPPADPTDSEFPFVLMTGRGTSAQWHTGSRTSKSEVLRSLAPPGCYVEINPADAARLDIAPNARVRIASRRASLLATAFVTPTVQPGQVFIPMHYPEVNRLTHPSFDPHSRQPDYKHCAVRVNLDG